MLVQNCIVDDLPAILALYDAARSLQIERNMVVWPSFSEGFLLNEIKEGRQWKITADGCIVCNWAITFTDRDIWGQRDKNDSIFIHRICNHPGHRGNRYIDVIVPWARQYAAANGKQYVRLDTLRNNTRLIQHYTSAGFTFLGIYQLDNTASLPLHYQTEPDCCLFEMEVE